MPYFSFVMVCYNNWDLTRNAIDTFFDSLSPQHQEKGLEFILVNNGSSDETGEGIEEFKARYSGTADIETIQLEQNLGYVNGVNIALSRCSGEIMAILNNDLVFCPGWFEGLAEQLEKNSEVGIAAPFITNGSGLENIILNFANSEMEQSFYKSRKAMNHYAKVIMEKNHNLILHGTRIVGACVALKKEVLDMIGGMDFWLGIGLFDDDDFTIRANIAGYRSVIVGKSFVYHIGNASFSKIRSISNAAILSNKMKFINKWKLRCAENIEGLFNSREEAILNTPYDRDKHFVPLSPQQADAQPSFPVNKVCGAKNVLLVADWTNSKSNWFQKLQAQMPVIDENDEIILWMPSTHFSKIEIENTARMISELVRPETEESHRSIKIIQNGIYAVNLPAFLKSFNSVMAVENDFVNMYIVYLAKQVGMDIS